MEKEKKKKQQFSKEFLANNFKHRSNAKAIQSKGGIATFRKKAAHRLLKDIMIDILNDAISIECLDVLKKEFPESSIFSNSDGLCLATLAKGLKGDISAFRVIMELIGEKPKEQMDVFNHQDISTIEVKYIDSDD